MTTLDLIITRYGLLLTLDNIAELFHSGRDSMRMQVNRGTPLGQKLKTCQFRMGRRIYFRAQGVAELLETNETSSDGTAA